MIRGYVKRVIRYGGKQIMIDTVIRGKDVFFSNGSKCGEIEWDDNWHTYHFIPNTRCKFSPEWLINIGRAIRRIT